MLSNFDVTMMNRQVGVWICRRLIEQYTSASLICARDSQQISFRKKSIYMPLQLAPVWHAGAGFRNCQSILFGNGDVVATAIAAKRMQQGLRLETSPITLNLHLRKLPGLLVLATRSVVTRSKLRLE